jgi:hypothetical protein
MKTGKWLLPQVYFIEQEQFPWYIARGKDHTLNFKVEKSVFIIGTPPRLPDSYTIRNNSPQTMEPLEETKIVDKAQMFSNYYDKVQLVADDRFNKLYIVTKDGKSGVVTKEQQEIVPLKYEEIRYTDSSLSTQLFIVKQKGKFGIVKGFKELVQPDYDNITAWHENERSFILSRNNKRGVYIHRRDSLPGVLIEPKYDYVSTWLLVQPNDFETSIPHVDRYLYNKGKTMVQIGFFSDRKVGYVDENGREFFKN